MANNPNILIGLKLKDIDDLKNKCQKDIDKLGKQLNLSISKIEIKDIDKATNKIQKQLNKISNQLTMNIKNIQLGNTDKVFKDLNRQIKQSIGNQDIKINTASDLKTVKGDFENILKYATLTRNEFKLVNGELAKMNTLTTKEGAVKSTTLTYQYDEARQAVEKYGWTAKQEGNKVVQVFDLISRKLVDNKKQLENNFTSQDKYLIGLENKLNKIKELSLRQGRANENYNNAKDLEEVVIIQNKINELKSKNNLLTQEEKNLLNQNIIELDNIVKKESGYAAEVNKTTQFLEKQIQTLESLKTNISNNKGNKEEEAKITNEINLQIEGYKKLIQQNEVLGSVEQNRIQKATNSIKQETNELITYGSKLKGILKSVAEYAVGGSALLGGVNVIKTGIDNIIELDSSMTTLKRVTSETTQTYKEFGDQANQTAIDIGHSTQEVINATADFAQAGFNSFKEDKDLAKISLIYSNVGDVSREEATKSMISTLKGFNLEAKDALSVVDKFNETSNKFSINAGGIGEALQRSASALHVAGNDISESIAMITAANTVVQDPSRVGNGLKTISMNLRGMKQTAEGAKPKLEKMMNTVTNGQVKITSLGKDGNKEFRSTYDILLDLSKVWGKLNSQQQAMLGEQIAGKHQANVFFSLMDQAKQLEEIKKTSMGSAGSAMAEEKAYMDSLKGRINALKENWKGLTMQLSNTSFLKNIISGANSILTAIRKIIDTFGVLPTLIGGITGAMVLFNDKFREKLENNILLLKKINNKFNDISKSFRDKARGITGFDDGKGDKIIGQFETLKNAFDSGEKSAIRYGASMVGLQAKLFAVKGAMVAAKVAAITLEAALTAGISLIASFVIEKAVEGFSALQKSIHMTREQLSEFNAEYIKNSSNSLKEIDNAERGLSKIQALKKEMNETSDGERRASLQKQLIELQREMVDTFPATASGLDSEGKKIATNNELIKAQINLKKEEARTSALNFFKKNKNTISELEGYKKQLDEVKKLQNDLENGKDFGKVQYRGAAAWAKRSVKDLEDMQKKMSETAQKAEGLRQAIQAYHAVGKTDTEINAIAGYNAVGALKSYDDALKEMSKSSESATSSSNGMNTALELVGENAENAAQKIKDLATNFGSLTGKLGVAKKALEEFQNKGRLSADTIQSIFNTGDTKLIASLGDASHFAQNLRGIIKNYSGEQKQAFNDEVNQARRMEYNKTNSAIKGSATRNSVTRNEVGNNKNAYNNDVGNFGNSEIAKANASSQSVNNRVSNEANGSQLFAGVYGKDIANQANAEAIKSNNTAQGVGARTGTEAVGCWNLSGLYGADTSNHASAQGIKTSNSAQSSDQRFGIENNATTNFAGLYGTDVNNHSGAQGTKVSNTGSAVNSIGSKHTGLVDSLGRVYGTDVENWSKAMNSKLEATSNFVGQAAQMLSSLSSVQTVEIGGFGSGMKANKFTDPRLGGLMMDAAKHMGRDPMAGYKALVDTSNVNSGYSPVSSGGYSPQSSDFVGFDNDSGGGSGGGSSYKPKKYSGSGGSGGGSSYKPK
ncbi:MAG: phage tail tape measure protein, partial [Bacilli bacterium]